MHISPAQLHNLAWFTVRIVILIYVGCSGNACVSQHQLNPLADNASQPPAVFSALPAVSRLASTSGDFLPFQNGADYAVDLACNRCAPADTFAQFTPDYVGAKEPLSDAAYCLYRLELDPAAVNATLALAWNGAAPASADCWVGLANWGGGGWDWQPLTTNEIEISNPATYGDSAKHCYAALVVLGSTPAELASISFGPLPPPPNNGYTLFAPMSDTTTYLIDDKGAVVHTWAGQYEPGASVFLGEDGMLWRQVRNGSAGFPLGGQAGLLEKVDWDGNVVWSYQLRTDTQCTHHDFSVLPNGNVLLIVWNKHTRNDVIAMGRDPATVDASGLFIDSIFEIEPSETDATIVWQWFASMHLVQDFDSSKRNFGDPAAHPELININYYALQNVDWLHLNSVDYNADLDQIVISSVCLSELMVIDHSTTTAEAAGHVGGRYGHGGDLLYRWGNQQAYGAGTSTDRKLYGQHDVHWIRTGLTGAGDLLIFNNQAGTPEDLQYSTVMEITTPLNPDGSYYMTGAAYGPEATVWQYKADPPTDFFGVNISSAQRLLNGNTLICVGPTGVFFEVTPSGENVWQYTNPYPPGGSTVFRATRYPADYPGLANLPK